MDHGLFVEQQEYPVLSCGTSQMVRHQQECNASEFACWHWTGGLNPISSEEP